MFAATGKKKELDAAAARARCSGRKRLSAQDSIPYERMWPDGVCRVSKGQYSMTILFHDINYELLSDDDQGTVFRQWCDLLSSMDASIHFQFTYTTLTANREQQMQRIRIPQRGDRYDALCTEFEQMMLHQLRTCGDGMEREKLLTVCISADSIQSARPRLEHILSDLLQQFGRLGSKASVLNGAERLKRLHGILHAGEQQPLSFSWEMLPRSGLSTKDFIAPPSLAFPSGRQFRIGEKYCAASFVQILAPELSDRVLVGLSALGHDHVVSLHLSAIDQQQAIRMLRRKITNLDKTKIDEQKKAIRSGYDMDIMPSDLVYSASGAKKILQDLLDRNERLYMLTLLVLTYGDSPRQLQNRLMQTSTFLQQSNCQLIPLDYLQEEGFASSLPLGINHVEIQRSVTTSAGAAFLPFRTQDVQQTGKDALYCGVNTLSGRLILADRKQLKNPNGLILGTPGSGKSFFAKREIINSFLLSDDDIFISDPEAEYLALTQRLGGQIIRISADSGDRINPFDLELSSVDDANPLSLKSDFILSLCELIIDSRNGLQPIQKTVIDRCVRQIYQPYLKDPVPRNLPTMQDLYEALLRQKEPEAKTVAASLELYVCGSQNLFNCRTNVDMHNRVVCFDIKSLGSQLKKIGMLVVQDQVWSRVSANREAGKSTRYYMDEMHLLLRDAQTAGYTAEIWKRFRKWGGIPTGLTQNVKDLLASREISSILDNSDYICMLTQRGEDRDILRDQLGLSPRQLDHVTQSEDGTGLLFYGSVVLPFADRCPKDTELYRMMTTRPADLRQELQ